MLSTSSRRDIAPIDFKKTQIHTQEINDFLRTSAISQYEHGRGNPNPHSYRFFFLKKREQHNISPLHSQTTCFRKTIPISITADVRTTTRSYICGLPLPSNGLFPPTVGSPELFM